jgi:endo-1,4-beta-xylanase
MENPKRSVHCRYPTSIQFTALLLMVIAFLTTGCAHETPPALKDVFTDAFLIGTAIDRHYLYADDPTAAEYVKPAHRRGYSYRHALIIDPKGLELTKQQFNSISAENVMKWEEIHPEPGVYDFDAADRFVRIGEENNMFIVGHTLIWHNQTPAWVFQDDEGNALGREVLLERMRDHIHTVVGRYKGRIHGWDVVNEAVELHGSLRESLWYRIIGEDYLVKAFQFAHEADPDAELYYNDFMMEVPSKRAGAIRLVRYLQEQGAQVNGIGSQSHFKLLDFPDLEEIENSITELAGLGIGVMVTELDISVLPVAFRGAMLTDEIDPYAGGIPDAVQEELTRRYSELFDIYLKHQDVISRITFWNVTDRDSWLNYLPVNGRTDYPLLFDRDYQPKPAFYSVIDLAREVLE